MICEIVLYRKYCSWVINGGELVIIYINEEGKEVSDCLFLVFVLFYV